MITTRVTLGGQGLGEAMFATRRRAGRGEAKYPIARCRLAPLATGAPPAPMSEPRR